MISDVLFEARHQIAEYLAQYPATYADMEGEILTLCAAMEQVEAKLDCPFSDEELR